MFHCLQLNSMHKSESIGNQPQSDFQQDVVRQMHRQESSGTWPRQRAVPVPRRGTSIIILCA